MNSTIFKAASHILSGVMLVFSVYLLLRGHNNPGGGFIAGLIGVIGFALLMLSHSPAYVYQRLVVRPAIIASIGMSLSIIAGTLSLFVGKPFLTGLWLKGTALGSPLLFDVGIYLVVFGSVLSILLHLEQELS